MSDRSAKKDSRSGPGIGDGRWVVKRIRHLSGLSKREMARRAETSPAALVEYESGRRSPSLTSLYRLAEACDLEIQITFRPKQSARDRELAGERLVQVLDLADALPKRPAAAQSAKAQYAS